MNVEWFLTQSVLCDPEQKFSKYVVLCFLEAPERSTQNNSDMFSGSREKSQLFLGLQEANYS